MKKILILQMRPEDEAANSEFEAILRVGAIDRTQTERFRLEQEKEFSYNLDDYSAIIAGGSPYDVSTPQHKKSKTQKRVEAFYNTLFDQVIPQDFPFLGACSGNGLLGNYCGSPISGKYAEPVGRVTVNKTIEGEKDPLLMDLPHHFPALVGHKEACDTVPEGATLLLSSDTCPVQMFRMKNNIYATQFHPEADGAEFILRIKTYQNFGYFNPEEAQKLIDSLVGVETPCAQMVLRGFIDRYLRE